MKIVRLFAVLAVAAAVWFRLQPDVRPLADVDASLAPSRPRDARATAVVPKPAPAAMAPAPTNGPYESTADANESLEQVVNRLDETQWARDAEIGVRLARDSTGDLRVEIDRPGPPRTPAELRALMAIRREIDEKFLQLARNPERGAPSLSYAINGQEVPALYWKKLTAGPEAVAAFEEENGLFR